MNNLQVTGTQDHRQVQVLQQTLQGQQTAMLAEVAARDARIQQLADDNKHAQLAFTSALHQMQSALTAQKHDSAQVLPVPV